MSTMASIESLQKQYKALDNKFASKVDVNIDPSCLLAFDYQYQSSDAEVVIDTDEFSAVCPWTGLPDFGSLLVRYVPDKSCIELKSMKYYLLSYIGVGIVQEHAANRILEDLVSLINPRKMTVELNYNVRGGLHTNVIVSWEQTPGA